MRKAIGARGDGFRVGELSDAVCTSFIIQKNLGCFGDGGAVVTNHDEVDRAIRKLRNHGSDKRSCHSPGYNSRLDDLQAGVLSAKLKHIDEWNALRRKWSARYSACLKDAATFTLPYEKPGYYHVFHLYVVETKKPEHRDPLLDFLNENGVDAKCHYPIAIHQQEGYPWGKAARIPEPVPNSERNAACCISLPMFPELTAEEVDYVIAKVLEWNRTRGCRMSDRYRVLVVGAGKRGMHHAAAFQANPRFEVAGICDIDAGAAETRSGEVGRHGEVDRCAAACHGASGPMCSASARCRIARGDGPHRHRMRRAADRDGEAGRADQRGRHADPRHARKPRRESSREPSASLWSALPEGEGDRGQRRTGTRPHGIRNVHRLDDAHAVAPDRLHALV